MAGQLTNMMDSQSAEFGPNFEEFGDDDHENEGLTSFNDNDFDDFELQDPDEDRHMLLSSVMSDDQDPAILSSLKETKIKGISNSKALVPAMHGDDGDDIDSDEEKEILKGIRDEVESKVRDEMKAELDAYKQRLQALEEGNPQAAIEDLKDDIFEKDEDQDPRLKEAIEKMNKLDKILRKKIRKEKEVKRDRILLERRMRHEISEMHHGATNYKEIKTNTEKYLALEPPPSHNAGVRLEEEDSSMPPLFQTQIDDAELSWKHNRANISAENNTPGGDNGSQRGESVNSGRDGKTRTSTRASNPERKGNAKKKDFIKRNKELAADAGQVIAMTDDEKKRLQDLLQDVDDMPEVGGTEDVGSLIQQDAFQISLPTGEGFHPDKTELKSLSSIDARLRAIMPEEDFLSLSSLDVSSTKATPQPAMFSRSAMNTSGEIPAHFGERVLYETREERELKARLEAIEQELDQFKAPKASETENESEFHLSDQQLDDLLEQCARSMSRMTSCHNTPDLSARSEVSSRQFLMEHPPKLSEDQLQQLLSEAHFPLSSTLLALRDDDQKLEEELGTTEAITAETWKAINEAPVSERDHYLNQALLARGASPPTAPDLLSPSSPSMEQGEDNSSCNNGILESFQTDDFSPRVSGVVNSLSSWEGASVSGSSQRSDSGGPSRHRESILPHISEGKTSRASLRQEAVGMTPNVTPSRSSGTLQEMGDNSSVRLPEIKSNSFLVQTSQGPHKEDKSGRERGGETSDPSSFNPSSSFQKGETSGGQIKPQSSGVMSPVVPRPPPSDSEKKKVSRP